MPTKKQKRPRPGRPALPDGERKSNRAYIICTDEEMAEIDARAEKAGLSRSEYLRRIVFKK